MAEETPMDPDNKREYRRINTVLPFQTRKVTNKNNCELHSRISSHDTVLHNFIPPKIENEELNMWLHMINAKLDYLINRDLPNNADSFSMNLQPVNISGSGMMTVMKEFQKGDLLEIKIALQSSPTKVIHLHGEVVRVEENPRQPGTKKVGVKFSDMDEAVRNEILTFDFKTYHERMKKKVANVSG
jgi:hypothetical protein